MEYKTLQLSDGLNEYLQSCRTRLSERTIKVYSGYLKRMTKHFGEHTLLKDISVTCIEEFINLQAQKHGYKESTRMNLINALKAFFLWHKALGNTDIPIELVRGPKIPERFPAFLSPEQFEWVQDYYNSNNYLELQRLLVFSMLFDTGMRIGELLALNLSDINSTECYTSITTEKTKKLRLVMWSDTTHDLLLRYLGLRLSLTGGTSLFINLKGENNTRLGARTVQRWCKKMSEDLGFQGITPHSFRHSKMHHIISQGGNRHQVMTIAGHSSIESSGVYTRLNKTEMKKVMGQFLNSKTPQVQSKPWPSMNYHHGVLDYSSGMR